MFRHILANSALVLAYWLFTVAQTIGDDPHGIMGYLLMMVFFLGAHGAVHLVRLVWYRSDRQRALGPAIGLLTVMVSGVVWLATLDLFMTRALTGKWPSIFQ